MFGLGNTSHDERTTYTYCSKVVYTAWKKAGVNVDANNFAGFLVAPDEIYSSALDRYFTITINLIFWKETYKVYTYNATTNVVMIKNR
jgi:uncharacterized protein YycO